MSIILLVGVLGFQFFLTNDLAGSDFSEEKMIQILSNPQGMISQLGKGYPPAFFGVKALINTGIERVWWLLLFIVMHLSGLYLALLIGEKTYYQTYLKLQDHYGGKERSYSPFAVEELSTVEDTFSALLRREWRYFLRIPSFAFNGFGNVIIFPVLIVIFYFAKNNPEFQQLFVFLDHSKKYFVPVGILLGTLVGSMNMLASTVFSREGKMLSELKILPVDDNVIFKAKLLHVMTMSSIGPFSIGVILILLFNISIWEGILVFLIAEVLVLFLNLLQIALDSTFPFLNWDNPQKAMKQNINGLYSILIVFGFSGLMGYLGYLLMDKISSVQMVFILLIIGFVGVILSYSLAKKGVRNMLKKDYC